MRTIQLACAAVLAASVLTPRSAGQPTFSVLYKFAGTPDGARPLAGVIKVNGVLYGTTEYGGTYNGGTVFELQIPAGSQPTETVLYSFAGQGGDGEHPTARLLPGANGVLYGTTALGGTSGYGTVFELMPPAAPGGTWTETVLYSFQGGDDELPDAGLVIGAHGELYGVTRGTVGSDYGEVFELQPPAAPGSTWTETVLYSMNTDPQVTGCYPNGLTRGAGGVLYVTAPACAAGKSGAVLALIPPGPQAPPGQAWTVSVLYAFMDGADGGYPEGPTVIGPGGILYGVTDYGGSMLSGTVFQLTPPSSPGGTWTETVLYTFTGGGDGGTPYAGLAMGTNGALYDQTEHGGAANEGTVFELQPPTAPGGAWTESVLYSFTDYYIEGYGPLFVDKAGTIYGTTTEGPGRRGHGIVFRIEP